MSEEDEKTQFLLEKALRGEKLTGAEASHVAQKAQENTDFRVRIEKIEGKLTKAAGVIGAIMATNFLNDFFG